MTIGGLVARNGGKKTAFRVSLAYNRAMHRLHQRRQGHNSWELWSEIKDLSGNSTRIILGQLPSPEWASKDASGEWGALGSTTFADFVDEHRIRGVLSVVEPFEWEFAGVGQLLADRGVAVSFQSQEDFSGMDPERMRDCVKFIEEMLRGDPEGKVYVHCKAGRGRSAAVVISFLSTPHADLQPDGPLDPATAHFVVRRCRSHIHVGGAKIPDLHQYYAREVLGHADPVWGPGPDPDKLHLEARDELWENRHELVNEYASTTQGRPLSSRATVQMSRYRERLQDLAPASEAPLVRGNSCPAFRTPGEREPSPSKSRIRSFMCGSKEQEQDQDQPNSLPSKQRPWMPSSPSSPSRSIPPESGLQHSP